MEQTQESYGPVTGSMIGHLQETKPWVRLVSIMGFVGAGLMVVMGLVMMFVGAMFEPNFGAGGGLIVGILYLLMAVIYFFVSRFLFLYAGAIQSLLRTRETVHMETALGHQKSFWRLIGILSVVYLILVGLGLIGVIIAGVFAALQ